MYKFFVLFIFLFFATFAYSEDCSNNEEIKKILENFGDYYENYHIGFDYKQCFDEFAKHPSEAACYLIRNLHTISQTQIRPEESESNKDAMKVIWSIRALKYLTNGKNFTAKTSYVFKKPEKTRKHFLTIFSEQELPFFSVWMSRDIIYIAPIDVQTKIIEQWKKWYSENGKDFIYKSSEAMDWYY